MCILGRVIVSERYEVVLVAEIDVCDVSWSGRRYDVTLASKWSVLSVYYWSSEYRNLFFNFESKTLGSHYKFDFLLFDIPSLYSYILIYDTCEY